MRKVYALLEFLSRPEVKEDIRDMLGGFIFYVILILAFGFVGGIEHGLIWP